MSFFSAMRVGSFRWFNAGHIEPPEDDNDYEAQILYRSHCAMAAWTMNGMPVFRLSNKAAALFACTQAPDEVLDQQIVPYSAFGVLIDSRIHPGIQEFFFLADMSRVFDQLFVMQPGGIWTDTFLLGVSTDERSYMRCADTLSELGKVRGDPNYVQGAMNVYGHIVTSLVLSLDRSGTSFRNTERRTHQSDARRGLPGYLEFRYTRPIAIDLRNACREAMDKCHSPLSIQTLVCGHWKMQAYGPGREKRKHIHIEPYWRGPEDAPVALRAPKGD